MAKARYNKKQLAQMDRDSAYWTCICSILGWKLSGFTYQKYASYKTDGQWSHLELSAEQRDSIVSAFCALGWKCDSKYFNAQDQEEQIPY